MSKSKIPPKKRDLSGVYPRLPREVSVGNYPLYYYTYLRDSVEYYDEEQDTEIEVEVLDDYESVANEENNATKQSSIEVDFSNEIVEYLLNGQFILRPSRLYNGHSEQSISLENLTYETIDQFFRYETSAEAMDKFRGGQYRKEIFNYLYEQWPEFPNYIELKSHQNYEQAKQVLLELNKIFEDGAELNGTEIQHERALSSQDRIETSYGGLSDHHISPENIQSVETKIPDIIDRLLSIIYSGAMVRKALSKKASFPANDLEERSARIEIKDLQQNLRSIAVQNFNLVKRLISILIRSKTKSKQKLRTSQLKMIDELVIYRLLQYIQIFGSTKSTSKMLLGIKKMNQKSGMIRPKTIQAKKTSVIEKKTVTKQRTVKKVLVPTLTAFAPLYKNLTQENLVGLRFGTLPDRFLISDGSLNRAIIGVDKSPNSPLRRQLDTIKKNIQSRLGTDEPERSELLEILRVDVGGFMRNVKSDGAGNAELPWDKDFSVDENIINNPPYVDTHASSRKIKKFSEAGKIPVEPLESYLEFAEGYCIQQSLIASLILSDFGFTNRIVNGAIIFKAERTFGHTWVELEDKTILDVGGRVVANPQRLTSSEFADLPEGLLLHQIKDDSQHPVRDWFQLPGYKFVFEGVERLTWRFEYNTYLITPLKGK